MKVEVLTTLKGSIGELFAKGTVFVSPDIPQTIMEELAEGRNKTVRVLEEDKEAVADVPVKAPTPIVTAPPVAPVVEPPPPLLPKAPVPSKKHPRMKR